ncbi:MAG TPA: YdeI/OmpD-associated family protein [Pyrinomonadaceae bacterium]|nr:YdeI/OmpD-associated family protein [Pyrinomonadaceae bacterium]
MAANKSKVKLRSVVEAVGDPVWYIVRIPRAKVDHFDFKKNLRRVICTLNGTERFNYALMPSKGDYFITLNKQRRKTLNLDIGDSVTLEIEKDESKYGMPMPEEFAEVLRQDPDGDKLFNDLSPGNQRLLLKLVVIVKDLDTRIHRALKAIEYLKRTNGKFVYDELYNAMKQPLL